MKQIKIILLGFALFIGLGALAQSTPFVQAGVGVNNKVFTQEGAIGFKSGDNQFAVVGETFEINKNTALENRIWYGGVQYGRSFGNLLATGAVKIGLNENTHNLVFEPGLAYDLNLGPVVTIQPSIGFPIQEGGKVFNPIAMKAGVALQLNF